MTIADLMSKAKEGDSKAYGELYQEYLTPIFRFIFFRVKNNDIAEDLTQTVFLKVLETKGSFEAKNLLKAYFYRTARNLVIDYWRKKKDVYIETTDFDFYSEVVSGIPEEMDNKIALVMVQKVIDQLDEKNKEIIILKFVNELDNKEIASVLGKSEMAVRQSLCRALKKMRLILDSYEK